MLFIIVRISKYRLRDEKNASRSLERSLESTTEDTEVYKENRDSAYFVFLRVLRGLMNLEYHPHAQLASALGKRVSKSSKPTHSGVTVMRT